MYHTTARRLSVFVLGIALSSAGLHACGNFFYDSGMQPSVNTQCCCASNEGDLLAAVHGKAVTDQDALRYLALVAQTIHNELLRKHDEQSVGCRLRHVTPSASSLDGDYEVPSHCNE